MGKGTPDSCLSRGTEPGLGEFHFSHLNKCCELTHAEEAAQLQRLDTWVAYFGPHNVFEILPRYLVRSFTFGVYMIVPVDAIAWAMDGQHTRAARSRVRAYSLPGTNIS